MPLQGSHIVVLGAGVIGLQTSVFLLEAGCQVTVIAEHFPGDESIEYTSPWAGADWRTFASPTDKRESGWDLETYEYWMKVLVEEQQRPTTAGKSAIGKFPMLIYWADDSKVEDLWWAPYVQDFRNLDERALPPRAHTGIAFTTISLDVPRYLANLQTRVRRLGGRVIRFRVPTRGGINVALDRIDAVLQPGDLDGLSRSGGKPKDAVKPTAYVNCTGMGALHLVPDLGVYPIRGQTVLVKGEATAARVLTSFDEKTQKWYTAYVIPRKGSGGTILGGTKEAGRWQAEAEEQTTKDILERCRELAPELLTGRKGRGNGGEGEDEEEVEGEFEVIRVNVGRRPGREGGARVELDEALGKNRILVHCYGHAGSGYQNSIGSAREVVNILKDRLEGSESSSSGDLKAKI